MNLLIVLHITIYCLTCVSSQIELDENIRSGRALTRVVTTKYGELRGFIATLSNKNLQHVEVYLGVPYASPPVSSLRFMPPVTPAHWRGTRPAEKFGPVCPQKLPDIRNETDALKRMPVGRLEHLRRLLPYLQNQSEDCLYLNIYSPSFGGKSASRVPVLVFIHGESYEWNAGNPYDGSVLAGFGNIIVVTVNFRLGVLGFLPATEGSARGNYGLMDQVAALHWVQENIAEFGGDPKNVTIFGQGHGAACVNFLVLSPMAKGLFHRAIMQSGSALSPWAIAYDANSYAQQIAKTLGCPTRQTAALLECMRQRSVADIMKVNITVPDFLTGFGPTVDGIVIQNEPFLMMEELADEHQYGNFDLMFGVTRVESYFHISAHEERYGIDSERRDRLLRTLVRNIFNYHLQEIFLTIINEYTDWTRPIQHAVNILDGTIDALGDAMVVAPSIRSANYHSIGPHKSYFYVFSYQTEDGDFPQRQGCVEGEDLHYIFGAPLVGTLAHFSRNYSRSEAQLAEAVMSYWVNFARTGDPNPPTQEIEMGGDRTKGRFDRILWPQYENVQQKYLMIGMKPKVRDHYHAHRLSFWLNLFPQLHMAGSSSISPEHHLLDDHDNVLSYDGVVRQVPFTSTSSPSPPSATLAAMLPLSTVSWNSSRRANIFLSTLRPSTAPVHERSGPTTTANITDSLAVVMQQSTYSTALSVTIAVGCSLLILNVLIFAGIYYQRDKNRAEEKMHKRSYARATDGQLMSTHPQVKQIPLRAPPPSPVCQTIQQQQQELSLHPPPPHHNLHHHHPTVNLLPPQVPPKPSLVMPPLRDTPAEAQPLLVQKRPSQYPNQQPQHNSQEMKL